MAEVATKKLKTNRGVFKTILLGIVTFGIYYLVLIHAVAKETNIVCNGDGKKTRGLLLLWLFSCLTLGIYCLVWFVKLANRTKAYVEANGGKARISGGKWFLWMWLGSMIIVGPFIAMGKLIRQVNDMNKIYNDKLDAAEAAAAPAEAPAEEAAPAEAPVEEAPVEETPAEAPAEEAPVEEAPAEAPTEE